MNRMRALRIGHADAGGELPSIHDRHDEVDQGEIDVFVAPEQIQRDPTVFGLDHPVIQRLERLNRQAPNRRVVIDDENGGGSAVMRNGTVLIDHLRERLPAARQQDGDCRALSDA